MSTVKVIFKATFYIFQAKAKKSESDRSKKRRRDSGDDGSTTSHKGRGTSVSSIEESKESKKEKKDDKSKSGFDKGLKAEKIIGDLFSDSYKCTGVSSPFSLFFCVFIVYWYIIAVAILKY